MYWLYFARTKWLGVGWMQGLLQTAGAANPIPGLRELLTNLVAPNWFIFAVGQTSGTTAAGILLLLCLATRSAGILGPFRPPRLAATMRSAVSDSGFPRPTIPSA